MLALVTLLLLAPQSLGVAATGRGVDACGDTVELALQASGDVTWTLRLVVAADVESNYNCGGLALRGHTFVGLWPDSGACWSDASATLCLDGGPHAGAWSVTYQRGDYAARGALVVPAQG